MKAIFQKLIEAFDHDTIAWPAKMARSSSGIDAPARKILFVGQLSACCLRGCGRMVLVVRKIYKFRIQLYFMWILTDRTAVWLG